MFARHIQRTVCKRLLSSQHTTPLRPPLSALWNKQYPQSYDFPRPQLRCGMTSSSDFGQGQELDDAPKNVANASKWGFIIYRCDYQSDNAWKEFIDGWTAIVKQDLRESYKDSEKLLHTMELTVRDDRSLDGASTEKVGMLHAAWAESDEIMAEQVEAGRTGTPSLARYSYCVHVDTASLNSCLKYFSLSQNEKDTFYLSTQDPAIGIAAYVNLVRTPYPRPINQDETDEEEGSDYSDDMPVTIKVHLPTVLPEVYGHVEALYDIWAREDTQDPDSVVFD